MLIFFIYYTFVSIHPTELFFCTNCNRQGSWLGPFFLLPCSFSCSLLPFSLFFFLFSPSLFNVPVTFPILLLEFISNDSIVKSLSSHFILGSGDIRPVKMKCYSQLCLILFVPITVNTSIFIKTFRSALSVPKELLTYQRKLWITVLLYFLYIIQSPCLKIFSYSSGYLFWKKKKKQLGVLSSSIRDSYVPLEVLILCF